MARGKHLFPFRTEQLSPSAPMVLGLHGPGRVGRRRLFSHEPPSRAARRRSGGCGPYAGRVEEGIILGENLDAMARLPDEAFQLVYADPPFNTGRAQTRRTL